MLTRNSISCSIKLSIITLRERSIAFNYQKQTDKLYPTNAENRFHWFDDSFGISIVSTVFFSFFLSSLFCISLFDWFRRHNRFIGIAQAITVIDSRVCMYPMNSIAVVRRECEQKKLYIYCTYIRHQNCNCKCN